MTASMKDSSQSRQRREVVYDLNQSQRQRESVAYPVRGKEVIGLRWIHLVIKMTLDALVA